MKVGKYQYVKPHKHCKHNGKLYECSRFIQWGTEPDEYDEEKWQWCNGRSYIKKDPNDPELAHIQPHWEFCGFSTRKA